MDKTEKKLTILILGILCLIIFYGAIRLQKQQEDVVLTIGVYSGSYWDTPNSDSYQILDTAIARFEREHPRVKVNYSLFSSNDTTTENLTFDIEPGSNSDGSCCRILAIAYRIAGIRR